MSSVARTVVPLGAGTVGPQDRGEIRLSALPRPRVQALLTRWLPGAQPGPWVPGLLCLRSNAAEKGRRGDRALMRRRRRVSQVLNQGDSAPCHPAAVVRASGRSPCRLAGAGACGAGACWGAVPSRGRGACLEPRRPRTSPPCSSTARVPGLWGSSGAEAEESKLRQDPEADRTDFAHCVNFWLFFYLEFYTYCFQRRKPWILALSL